MKKIYNIPEFNFEKFKSKIEYVNKKCIKLGFPEIKTNILKTYFKDGIFNIYEVEIDGETPKIDNWKFVAKLEHTEKGNIIRNISLYQIPNYFRETSPKCEHCNVNRKRNDTFVLKNQITGEFKQVGKNCLSDFLGGIDPHNVALYCEYLKDIELLENYSDDDVENFSKIKSYFPLFDVLALSHFFIKTYGYVKKIDSNSEKKATFQRVIDSFKEKENIKILLSNEDIKDMINWVNNSLEDNEYINNLKILCQFEYVEEKNIGILASLPIVYQKYIDKKNEEKIKKTSEYIGSSIGGKVCIRVLLQKTISFEGNWGINYIHIFKDENDNVIKWKTSIFMEENKMYEITGKIKNYETYKGVKQTELTRCKFIEC